MTTFSRRPATAVVSLTLLLVCAIPGRGQAADDIRIHLDRFAQVLALIQNNYVEAPDNEKLINGAIDGILRTLDPHCTVVAELSSQDVGIGINFDLRDGAIVVIAPLEGSPASRLDLRAGDRIVEFDGKPLSKTITTNDVFKMLRGPAGTVANVTIERDGSFEPLHFTIERTKVPNVSVPYSYMLRPGVGYVRITRFAQTTRKELEKALTSLSQQGMKSLLLDLRRNSGGLLSQAVEVLDLMVPQKTRVVYTRGRIASANADYYTSERPKLADGPIVVLIDHGSAAAAEIVAGAIQDLDRGLVAGVNSFGDGLVQNQLRLSDGSNLLLTIAKYYTPSGRLIQSPYDKSADRSESVEDAARKNLPNDSELAPRPKFKTAGGRSVFGGGGIHPDVVLKEPAPLTRSEIDMIQKKVFLEFAGHYIAQRKSEQWTAQSLGKDFKLNDADWEALRQIVLNRAPAVGDSAWAAGRAFMLQQVRAEIAAASMNQLERYKILVEDDPQMMSALELFPEATKLMSKPTRGSEGTGGDSKR